MEMEVSLATVGTYTRCFRDVYVKMMLMRCDKKSDPMSGIITHVATMHSNIITISTEAGQQQNLFFIITYRMSQWE